MSKKIYWKDIRQSFSKSKGRFFSIFSLMAIGAIALVGLKVTTPNMQRTAQTFIETYNTMDLAVMADYGLSEEDIAELSSLEEATVEFGYLEDVTVADSNTAVRVYSETQEVSQFELVSGAFPTDKTEIALANSMSDDYQIGDSISFTTDSDSSLETTTYTVTGFVNSSEIWDTDDMGQSSAGTGQLAGYALVTDDAFDSDIYMIARISYADLDGVGFATDAYEEKLRDHQDDLDVLLADNGEARLASLKADAQAEIDEGTQEIADAEKKLADAAQKITDAESEIADGESQLATAKEQVTTGEAELASSKTQLDSAAATLQSTAAQLASAKSQLDTAKSTLDSTKSQLDAAASQLTTAKNTLDSKKTELDSAASQIASAESALATAKSTLASQKQALIAAGQDPTTNPDIIAAEAQIVTQEEALASAKVIYEAGLAQYEAGFASYEENKAIYDQGLAQYQAGLATYESNLAQYNAGMAAYQAGLTEYNSGYAQYQTGLAELEEAKATITKNQATLEEAQAELADGKAEYAEQKADADVEIADAKVDLADAQEEVDQLTEPAYTSYTRTTIPGGDGYVTYSSGSTSIAAVGDIFPVVLYIVAAMVTLTTMTRFVDEERTQAGIFKALGYTNRQIIAKFVIYGLIASLTGTLVGILVGNFFLSPMIGDILTSSTVIGASNIYFYPSWTLLAILLALISAVLPAYLVARRELSEKPAQLLLAKPPVAGSKILLERLPFIWKRLSFTHKVTARNIFRYKQRMLMTLFGVAGSVALLFAGLGIRSSISGVADTQFGQIIGYDLIVAESSTADEKETAAVDELLASDAVASSLAIRYLTLSESIPGESEEQSISLIVADDSKAFSDYIDLRNRASQESLSLTDDGVILSEKLADLYEVSAGDELTVTIDNKEVTVKVTGITEMYAGHYIYMTADYYEALTDQTFETNSALVILSDDSSDNVQVVAADFLALDGVVAVVHNSAMENMLHTVAGSLQSVMIVLIVLSILLAVVILYNLTNINVAERIRELSTIKVLGFHNKEVTMYIYRETIVLSIIGILTGLAGGWVLHRVILNMIGSSQLMFKPTVGIEVYLTPIIAIVGILAVLGIFVNYKLRHVDMLGALKSVE